MKLNELVLGVVDQLNVSSQDHSLIVFDHAVDLEVIGDSERIIQVLTNLISNAIKFSPGGGDVTIALKNEQKRVIVSITDQGLGIPAAEVNQLFQKFKRIDNSESRKIGGTGLGLAICKEIIDKHEGEIWVDSIEGQGSTFSFSVPLAAPKKEIAGAQDVSLSRVMLLEDDTSLALLLSDELKASGFSVVHHYKPDRAIEDAQNETFVSIVVDIMLGEDQNGWDVIRKLKESDQTNHIPIIVSSALDTDESKVKEFGVEAYLTKPYSPERLSEIIQSIVHRDESN